MLYSSKIFSNKNDFWNFLSKREKKKLTWSLIFTQDKWHMMVFYFFCAHRALKRLCVLIIFEIIWIMINPYAILMHLRFGNITHGKAIIIDALESNTNLSAFIMDFRANLIATLFINDIKISNYQNFKNLNTLLLFFASLLWS